MGKTSAAESPIQYQPHSILQYLDNETPASRALLFFSSSSSILNYPLRDGSHHLLSSSTKQPSNIRASSFDSNPNLRPQCSSETRLFDAQDPREAPVPLCLFHGLPGSHRRPTRHVLPIPTILTPSAGSKQCQVLALGFPGSLSTYYSRRNALMNLLNSSGEYPYRAFSRPCLIGITWQHRGRCLAWLPGVMTSFSAWYDGHGTTLLSLNPSDLNLSTLQSSL